MDTVTLGCCVDLLICLRNVRNCKFRSHVAWINYYACLLVIKMVPDGGIIVVSDDFRSRCYVNVLDLVGVLFGAFVHYRIECFKQCPSLDHFQ